MGKTPKAIGSIIRKMIMYFYSLFNLYFEYFKTCDKFNLKNAYLDYPVNS